MSTILLTCLLSQIPLALGILPDEFGPLSKGFQHVVVRNLSDHHNWPGWNSHNGTQEPRSFTPLPGMNRTRREDDRNQTGRHNGTFPWSRNGNQTWRQNGTFPWPMNGNQTWNETFPWPDNGNSSDDGRMHPIFPPFPKIANGTGPIMRRNRTTTTTNPLPSFPTVTGNGLETETARRMIERDVEDNHNPIGINDNHSPLLPQESSSTGSPPTTEFTFPTPTGVFVGEGGLPLQIEPVNPPIPGVIPSGATPKQGQLIYPRNSGVFVGERGIPLQFDGRNGRDSGLQGSTLSTPRPNNRAFFGRGGIPLQFDGGALTTNL